MIITVIATAIAKTSINNINYALYNKQMADAHLLAESKLAEISATDKKIILNHGSEKINNTEFQWDIQNSVVKVNDMNEEHNIDMNEIIITVSWECKSEKKEISIKEYIYGKTL